MRYRADNETNTQTSAKTAPPAATAIGVSKERDGGDNARTQRETYRPRLRQTARHRVCQRAGDSCEELLGS